jgi:hypothetical protein
MPELPMSEALREAMPDSISELYSRDIEALSDDEIDLIIAEQRANRARLEAAEAAGVKPPRAKPSTLSKALKGFKPQADIDSSQLEDI